MTFDESNFFISKKKRKKGMLSYIILYTTINQQLISYYCMTFTIRDCGITVVAS